MRHLITVLTAAFLLVPGFVYAQQACSFSYPVGIADGSPAPLTNNHPVNGTNLPQYGRHLGGDYWSGSGCTDFGATVWAVANGEVVEIVDGLGSYLDVVVIRHDVPDLGNVYSMYGHIDRAPGLSEGQTVTRRQTIGTIDDVLAYFSPCHLHFELLNESAYQNGPFCNGCANAGYHVSPGYDRSLGVEWKTAPTGDTYLHVLNDGIADNGWYDTDPFIASRLNATCGTPDYETTATQLPERVWRDMPAGAASITVRNNGTLPWRAGQNFRLASTSSNQFIWQAGDNGYCNGPGDCRLFLPRDVSPGQSVTFDFTIVLDQGLGEPAGAAFGVGWQMVKDGDAAVGFFGPSESATVELCNDSRLSECDAGSPPRDAGPNTDGGAVVPPPQTDSGTTSNPATTDDASGEGTQSSDNGIDGVGSACSSVEGRGLAPFLLLLGLLPLRRLKGRDDR